MSDNEKGYDVGYGKPPDRTKFKKGQSGNPRGRPRKGETPTIPHGEELNRVLLRVANLPLPVREGGKEAETLPGIAAVYKRLLFEAASGKAWAVKAFIKMVEEAYVKESGLQQRLLQMEFDLEDARKKEESEMTPVQFEERRYRRWKFSRSMRRGSGGEEEFPYEANEPGTDEEWEMYKRHVVKVQKGLAKFMDWPPEDTTGRREDKE